jgi:hydroxymethylpyrimidine pyrophosphatase-like HAD family hydrolase
MSLIRLLSTDFDGTLIGGSWGESCAPVLAEELATTVSSGAIWVVNTGRSLESALDGLEKLGAPVKPEYILTSERHIYHPDGRGGWHDYGDWNRICRNHHDLLFAQSGEFFDNVRELVDRTPGLSMQGNGSGVPEGLIAETEELLDQVALELDRLPGRQEDFHYQRSNIYLRFCHRLYDKGSSLAELSRLLDTPTTEILAIGDHQNDLAMLYGSVAAMVACPVNAHPSVKETVRKAGGHISELEAGEGTAEAIHLYRTGMIKSGKSR